MRPYTSNWDHLQDELNRLDLLLRLHLAAEAQEPPQAPANPYRGLFLQRQEIMASLNPDPPETTPDDQALREELIRLDRSIAERVALGERQDVYLPLARLWELFRLSPFQRMVVLICLAPELDRKYEKIYAYLQDDLTRKSPGVDLVFRLLVPPGEERLMARREFDPQAPLARYLLRIAGEDGGVPLLARTLKLEDRIVDFITGHNRPDIRLAPFIRLQDPEAGPEDLPIQSRIPERIEQFLNDFWGRREELAARRHPVFYFYGPAGAGKQQTAWAACRRLGAALLTADLSRITASDLPWREAIRLLVRESLLQNAALCLENPEALAGDGDPRPASRELLRELFRDCAPLVFILGEGPWKQVDLNEEYTILEIEFAIPEEAERQSLWESFSRGYSLDPGVDLADFAGKFRFTPGRIEAALRLAGQTACWEDPGAGRIQAAGLYRACHRLSNQKLSGLAQKITARYTWDALVLPKDQLEQLQEICDQVKYRRQVFGDWRFGRKLSLGKGLNALFSGPPGCGKTIAAEVIAGALSLELYKIDLSRVVSKYIGETEKNLGRIFAEAETSNAILFFDEADALFGKRSEVKDAHDRYANIETGYLLQKMEEYEGLVILATNLSQNMDQAFLRRMQFIIEFPLPEKPERAGIWHRIFPAEAPLGDINYDFLAEKLKLAGGNIKNIALRAAFYAAAESQPIGMNHILRAIRREYQKMGKMFLPNDFEPYKNII